MNSEKQVRRTGLLKTVGGLIAIYALWPLQLMALLKRLMDNEDPSSILDAFEYPILMAMTLPFLLFFIGACELASGTPFRQISAKWSQMSQIKQGLFSFLLIITAVGLIALAIYLYVRQWM